MLDQPCWFPAAGSSILCLVPSSLLELPEHSRELGGGEGEHLEGAGQRLVAQRLVDLQVGLGVPGRGTDDAGRVTWSWGGEEPDSRGRSPWRPLATGVM